MRAGRVRNGADRWQTHREDEGPQDPAAKRKHAEGSPDAGASHPSFPGLGTRKAGAKLG